MNFKDIFLMMGVVLLLFGSNFFIISQNNNQDNLVQMAILLDTSNSMDGLIDQAKSNLWKIVNELALARKNGQIPELQVALYEYGKDSLPKRENYLRKVVALTSDLDLISEELFQLTTNGGDEYCGAVIDAAVKELNWTRNNNILKVVFIAGNEPFDQGKTDYRKAVKRAISKGIIVNTIFCGDMQEGMDTGWKEGADLADGSYINIDQNLVEEYVEAPQDKEIMELNNRLNQTYLAYGSRGKSKQEMQKKQDSNARAMSEESVIQRAITKSSKSYNNAGWDLVDAYEQEEVQIDEISDADLPAEMKGMSDQEKEKYIKKLLQERKEIQEKIQKLNTERKAYIDKKKKQQSEKSSLDDAIIQAIKKQAIRKNYQFK